MSNFLTQCYKCGGTGVQINYSQGRDVKSRCSNCRGHGFRAVSKKPTNRDSFLNVVIITPAGRASARFYVSDGFDFGAAIDCFNRRNTKWSISY